MKVFDQVEGTAHGAVRATAGARAPGVASWSALWLGVRALGALAVLVVGAIHLQQYLKLYSAIPTIGTLFVLNFAGATAIGLGLLARSSGCSAAAGAACCWACLPSPASAWRRRRSYS
jgi:hypothetical protein